MRVVIEVYASLRERLGWSKKVIELDNDCEVTLGDILRMVPELYEEVVDRETGDISEDMLVFINGVHAQLRGGLRAPIRDGDTISIFPPVAGG